MNQVWIGKNFSPDEEAPPHEPTYFGAKHLDNAAQKIHPVGDRDATSVITCGVGPWTDKICHFRPGLPPSSAGEEIQTEYFLPYDNWIPAVEALYKIRDKFIHLQ